MKAVRLLSLAALVAVTLAPAALASGRKPGSVLFYPTVVTNVTGGHAIVTLVTVTNTNLDPVVFFTGTGGTTAAHFEYVNATFSPTDLRNPPFASCNIVNHTPILTPGDTLTVLTACDNGNSLATRLGYLVITAEDPAFSATPGTPWKHDFLIGSEMQLDFGTGCSYALNAIPFNAGASLASHEKTDRTPTLNGNLDFDGTEYEQVPDQLYGDSVFTNLLPSLALINLEGGINAINTVQMNMYDDNEHPFSVSFPFRCWFEWPLFLINDFFNPNTQFLSLVDNNDEVNLTCIGIGSPSPWNFVWFQVESINVQPNEFGGLSTSSDGALLGAITAGDGFPVGFPTPNTFSNGHLLWESVAPNEDNGSFLEP